MVCKQKHCDPCAVLAPRLRRVIHILQYDITAATTAHRAAQKRPRQRPWLPYSRHIHTLASTALAQL